MGQPRRPMPPDFLEVAPTLSQLGLRQHYKTGVDTVIRWLREAQVQSLGVKRRKRFEVPSDFATYAPLMSNGALGFRYGVSDHTAARWRDECGIAPYIEAARKGVILKRLPDDFADVARTMSRKRLRMHYGVGSEIIRRWCFEAGVNPPKPTQRFYRRQVERGTVVAIDTRDGSEASRAQSWLQRYYPVWRCTPEGTFDPKGSHYRCDGIVRTQAEMIERAKRKGFNPDEWRQAA